MQLEIETWLRPEDLNVGTDTAVVFLDEGRVGEFVKDGESKPTFEITVSLSPKENRVWTMNKTSQRAVASAYGSDTKSWVGKTVKLYVAETVISGKLKKVVYARAPDKAS